PPHADRPGQHRRVQERCLTIAERHEVCRIADGENGVVAPHAPTRKGRARPRAAQRREIVNGLEEAAASRTCEAIGEGRLGAAVDASEAQHARARPVHAANLWGASGPVNVDPPVRHPRCASATPRSTAAAPRAKGTVRISWPARIAIVAAISGTRNEKPTTRLVAARARATYQRRFPMAIVARERKGRRNHRAIDRPLQRTAWRP